ncbi:MAG: hypothetical protein QHH18_02735 [Candidatus Bathyarchaeota archaeon]|jgi:hypothetical protein|nr:hypothetical protein [Candidatus Bathyarchaeota archaeon A05DMB-5]MDH7557511.1 hypothetical protein [Candidatus Bathyarchaeota archaeon]
MSQHKPTLDEIKFLQEALRADLKIVNIRLREGEYQYALAKAIASFQLELYFPDVKDLVKRLYGEEKTNDIQFIRKIQTILKKMEKSNIVKILPKKRPWDLQRYALSSFKFQDADKNLVILVTEQEMKDAKELLENALARQQNVVTKKMVNIKAQVFVFALTTLMLYAAALWAITQPVIDPFIFVFAFSFATLCSVMLGKSLAKI